MIVNTGKLQLLDAQRPFLGFCYWGLFTNNLAIAAGTILANLTPAAWAGYVLVNGITWSVPAIVAAKAVTSGSPNVIFGNSSGALQSFYGWYVIDVSQTYLIAAVNIGLTTIANGANYVLTPTVSDDQA